VIGEERKLDTLVPRADRGKERLTAGAGTLLIAVAVVLLITDGVEAAVWPAFFGAALVGVGIAKAIELRPQGAWDRRLAFELWAIRGVAVAGFGALWIVSGADPVIGILGLIGVALAVVSTEELLRAARGRKPLLAGRFSAPMPVIRDYDPLADQHVMVGAQAEALEHGYGCTRCGRAFAGEPAAVYHARHDHREAEPVTIVSF
jgi:hypothetical protein